jgi:diaminopimelate decarboxylase
MTDLLAPFPDDSVLSLFPETVGVTPTGELAIGGVTLSTVAAEFGTPAYVVDVAGLRRQARRLAGGLAERWPNSEVLFASKSFPAVAVYRVAAEEGLSVDVAGAGEIVMALAAGVDPARLYFHGNAKTEDELVQALDARVGTIIVDNVDELDRLERLATAPQDVLVRLIPGVAPDTHWSHSTGGNDSKFGLPFEHAVAAMERIRASRWLRLAGVHVHIGSQVLAAEPFAEAVRQIAQLGDLPVYDLGGGLGVRYTYAEKAPTIDEYLDAIVDTARTVLPAGAKLLIEPGRSLVARAGISLYRVVSVKRTGRTFVALDGGMADNMDIALTQQRYEAVIAGRPLAAGNVRCDVVGRQCESGDRFIEGIDLPDPVVGDLVAVPATGAYSYTMANNYNGARRPPVVFIEHGEAHAVVRRETFDDMLHLQVLPGSPE